MKFLLSICVILATPLSWSQDEPKCRPIALPSEVQVSTGEVSLADLLPGACLALRQAASGIRIGSAPLAGSARVFARNEVEALLSRLPTGIAGEKIVVPERVVIRRVGLGAIANLRRDSERKSSQHSAPLVRRGETVLLSWDTGGIRVRVPGISLDTGAAGDLVSVRLGSGRILHATVVGRGMLQPAS